MVNEKIVNEKMALFYVPNLSAASILPEEESLHAVKVLRLKSGDSIQIVDGKGGFYNALITTPHHKHCAFEITETLVDASRRNYKLHIAIAPTKNIERLEWFIEKATEIGIDEITPVFCQNSERKVVKEERLEKIIVSAAKQSKKAQFPTLNPPCTFDQLIMSYKADQQFIAHCYTSPQPSPTERENEGGMNASSNESSYFERKLLKSEIAIGKSVLILIGPEGDFSPEEVNTAIKNGYQPVSLGDSRLRTETAGVVACCTVAFCN
jgi:16S rRNA (uracil1498-N3)-methyltransferase